MVKLFRIFILELVVMGCCLLKVYPMNSDANQNLVTYVIVGLHQPIQGFIATSHGDCFYKFEDGNDWCANSDGSQMLEESNFVCLFEIRNSFCLIFSLPVVVSDTSVYDDELFHVMDKLSNPNHYKG